MSVINSAVSGVINSTGCTTGPLGSAYPPSNSTGMLNNYWYSNNFIQTTSEVIVKNNIGEELVRINDDGTVEWKNGIKIDEAAESFSKSLTLGMELVSGINYKTKQAIRDIVFSELIGIAKEKGTLDATELTYMLQTAKIMDKLRHI